MASAVYEHSILGRISVRAIQGQGKDEGGNLTEYLI